MKNTEIIFNAIKKINDVSNEDLLKREVTIKNREEVINWVAE